MDANLIDEVWNPDNQLLLIKQRVETQTYEEFKQVKIDLIRAL